MIGCLAAGASLGLGGGRVAGVVVYHMGLGTDRVYIHIEVEGGPAVGVWEIRHEPPLLHTGEGEPEPGKWVIMLPDGGVRFAEAEEAMAFTLRHPLEALLGHEVADEVFGQLPQDW
jgi:hypothetical protein